MQSTPPTPTPRRRSSGNATHLASPSASPQNDSSPFKQSSNSRRSSYSSEASPSTARPSPSHDSSGYLETSKGFDDLVDFSNETGHGNLADELAEALEEEDENGHELGDGAPEAPGDRAEAICHDRSKENEHPKAKNCNHNTFVASTLPVRTATSDLALRIPKQSLRFGHARRRSQCDGSDYGNDSDLDDRNGISASLEARIAAVESLTHRNTEANGGNADEIVPRLVDALKDLGSQNGVENRATRLIASHTALTTHLSHQTRALLTLTHALVSPVSFAPPDAEFIDDLLPQLASLVLALPTPMSHALSSLRGLHASTADLAEVLSYLSDTLHMMRQTTSLASRRLRVARELVVEMRGEMEAKEMGIHWVEKGNWQGRLAGRECARVCGEVVGGFEEVCASWRKKLANGMVGVEVGAA
ncbi:hypothetical protein BDR22DRAFT_856357 [Usnea florida]